MYGNFYNGYNNFSSTSSKSSSNKNNNNYPRNQTNSNYLPNPIIRGIDSISQNNKYKNNSIYDTSYNKNTNYNDYNYNSINKGNQYGINQNKPSNPYLNEKKYYSQIYSSRPTNSIINMNYPLTQNETHNYGQKTSLHGSCRPRTGRPFRRQFPSIRHHRSHPGLERR